MLVQGDVNMIKSTIFFASADKIHKLSGVLYEPDQEPKGIFHVVHGMNEHKGRYDDFLREMCGSGYICIAYDNLGHGETVRDKSERGFFASKDGYKLLAEDVYSVSRQMKQKYPGLPYYLMGHSMGSFIVRLAACIHPEIPDKLIVMGTAGPNPVLNPSLCLINIIKAIYGEKHISMFLEKLAFGKFNEHFTETGGDWLAKDPEVRRLLDSDEMCDFHFTISAFYDLIKMNSVVNSKQWFYSINKKMPILLISGKDDPVGDYGKGVFAVFKKLKVSGADVQLKLYRDNRHELLDDTARDKVISDIMSFLSA